MIFELASKEDTDTILELYHSVLDTPYCRWSLEYPRMEDIEDDLSREGLFCLKEQGEIIAVISIDKDDDVAALSCWSKELQPNRTLINDALVITVNGVETNVLPTEPGTYEISVYYGELYNRLDVVHTDVEILGFGHFMIDCEGFEEQHPDWNKGE